MATSSDLQEAKLKAQDKLSRLLAVEFLDSKVEKDYLEDFLEYILKECRAKAKTSRVENQPGSKLHQRAILELEGPKQVEQSVLILKQRYNVLSPSELVNHIISVEKQVVSLDKNFKLDRKIRVTLYDRTFSHPDDPHIPAHISLIIRKFQAVAEINGDGEEIHNSVGTRVYELKMRSYASVIACEYLYGGHYVTGTLLQVCRKDAPKKVLAELHSASKTYPCEICQMRFDY